MSFSITIIREGRETHRLEKCADRWKNVKRTFSRLTNKLCGTREARQEALQNSMLRQFNAGVSQQDVILPESLDDVNPPVIDLGGNNQAPNNQGQNIEVVIAEEENEEDYIDIDSPPVRYDKTY